MSEFFFKLSTGQISSGIFISHHHCKHHASSIHNQAPSPTKLCSNALWVIPLSALQNPLPSHAEQLEFPVGSLEKTPTQACSTNMVPDPVEEQ